MRDEEYLFKEDVREKAITARSAKKRPRHSGCRLPQYTAKEMREMSGPTYTLNLKKRITYAEFKTLPEGLQKSYVQNIIDKYRVDPSALAELMGANAGAVGVYLSREAFPSSGFSAYEGRPREIPRGLWYQHECADKKITLENFSFCFSGAFNAASFVKQIKAFVPEGQLLRVSVAVEVVEPEPSATEPATEESP
ncbi:MAG: hypothetical protein ACLSG5_14620 [Oscillospiraceae bacterium]